jgi:hypothetical protein
MILAWILYFVVLVGLPTYVYLWNYLPEMLDKWFAESDRQEEARLQQKINDLWFKVYEPLVEKIMMENVRHVLWKNAENINRNHRSIFIEHSPGIYWSTSKYELTKEGSVVIRDRTPPTDNPGI